MQRCLRLAEMAAGSVAPNPVVGAVLVNDARIIGEGYHMRYGEPHAEVNCINNVKEEDRKLIPESTLYVSLEPCAHFGKTPPCTDLIISNRIANVVIGCRDSFEAVNGRGIEKLRAAGVNVVEGILGEECIAMNKRFFTFHEKQRPYIILKWAQSSDGRMAGEDTGRTKISNELTDRLVHKWRGEEDSILVGTATALTDDPSLTTRLWPGSNPVRLVIDKELKLPPHLKLFDGTVETIIFNYLKQEDSGKLHYQKLNREDDLLKQLQTDLYKRKIQSVLVEGGAKLLQSFIDAGYWDEARVITNEQMTIGNGLHAPILKGEELIKSEKLGSDTITYYERKR